MNHDRWEQAVQKLINMIYGEEEETEVIKPWIVDRASTGD